jgi:hypothetical protein
MYRFAWLFVVGCAIVSGAAAQDTDRGPDGGTSTRVSGVEVQTIPGKPFSASTSTDWTRTLEDGTTVTLRLDAKIVRDGSGRVYRERHHFVPAASHNASPLYEIHIYDPVARVEILCDGRHYHCTVRNYKPHNYFTTPLEGATRDGSRTLARESLGSDNIEGIPVVGTRETTTVNPGAMGNDRAMVSSREFWYSDELQTNLAVTRIDPRNGKEVIRLSGISREEPDEHIFEIPIGFSVVDLRRPHLGTR